MIRNNPVGQAFQIGQRFKRGTQFGAEHTVGKEKFNPVLAVVDFGQVEQWLGVFTPQERTTLVTLMQRLVAAMEKE